MSDYMFMLESHLSSEQSRVVADVQAVAVHANVNVFLTGGAMRDMLGGFPIRELDFTVEGPAIKLSKTIAQKSRAQLLRVDEERKQVLLQFPGGVNASIAMARLEKYAKPGAKPQVQPATIHEDLRGRDFTINSIALSLNPASRGSSWILTTESAISSIKSCARSRITRSTTTPFACCGCSVFR